MAKGPKTLRNEDTLDALASSLMDEADNAPDTQTTDEAGEDTTADAGSNATDTPAEQPADSGDSEKKPAAKPGTKQTDAGAAEGEVGGFVPRNAYNGLMRQNTKLLREYEAAQTQLAVLREAASAPQQLGLTPQETLNAVRMWADFKKDPVNTTKQFLADVRAAGYNIDDLGGGAVDMAALKKMINEAVAPFQQDREAVTRETESMDYARNQIEELVTEMPEMGNHLDMLAQLMDRAPPHYTLREVALRLQVYAAQNGYDLSKPLAPQQRAKSAPPQPRAPSNARQPARSNAAPMSPHAAPSAPFSNNSAGFRDEVRAAFAEAGLQVE